MVENPVLKLDKIRELWLSKVNERYFLFTSFLLLLLTMTHHYNLRNSAKNITTNMEQEQQIVNQPPASSVQPSSENNAAPGPNSGPAMNLTCLQRQIAEMQQALNHVAARLPVQTASAKFNVGSGLLQPRQCQGLPDEDPLGWLDRFDAWVDLKNVVNRQLPHAIRLLLSGSAVSWFSALPTEDRENKERLYTAFRNRFGQQPSWLMEQQLWSRTVLDHEDIEVYISDIDQRCHRLGMDGKTQESAFVRGSLHIFESTSNSRTRQLSKKRLKPHG